MTTQELRELDAWIGVNVFGKKAIHRDGPRPAKGTEDNYFIIEFVNISGSLPFYSTDSARAMEVLKRCADALRGNAVSVLKCDADGWIASSCGTWHRAETLELAICLFAKQLFSKDSK